MTTRFIIFLLVLFLGTCPNDATAQSPAPGIDTVAGSGSIGDGGPATSAVLRQTGGLAAGAGVLYISETAANRVRRVDRSGLITTVAGTGVAGFSGDGAAATSAQLNAPYGVATDLIGNLYIADLGNSRIRRVDANGNITTIAGGGTLVPGGTNEGAAAAKIALKSPRNIVVDDSGIIYFSDFALHRVFAIATDGTLTTAAGNGVSGYSGDGAIATSAKLSFPAGLALDYQSALYIADSQNGVVRQVNHGVITTLLKGVTPTAVAIDATLAVWVADPGAALLTKYPPGGATKTFALTGSALTRGSDLNMYASVDQTADNKSIINRIATDGTISIAAGGGNPASGDGASAVLANLNHPAAVAVDGSGNLWIADRDNNRIRMVDKAGVISTVAVTVNQPSGLSQPNGISLDSAGNLYIADTGNKRVLKVTPSATTTLATGTTPVSVAADASGNIYFADLGAGTNSGTISKIDAAGKVTVLQSNLSGPRGIAVLASTLYFTEENAARVSKLNLNTGALTAVGTWNIPRGIAVAADGTILVADTGRQQIVLVDATSKLSIAAGTGAIGYAGDGGAATSAQLNFPWGVAVNTSGDLFIADLNNNRIRRVKSLLTIGADTGTGDGTGGGAVSLSVLNGASLATTVIAPGMLVILQGTGLKATDQPNTQVLVNSILTPIVSMNNTQIQVQAPLSLVIGTARITIVFNGAILVTADVTSAASAPALFASSNTSTNPASRGSTITLFGTGLGLGDLPVAISIGGVSAPLVSLNPSPGYPGLFQVNAQVPVGLAAGIQNLIVSVGTVASPATQIAVN